MEYPKINSLYKREGCGPFNEEKKRYECDLQRKKRKSRLIMGDYACEEFEAIKTWTITEKVDGTNVRISMEKRQEHGSMDERIIRFGGRTDNAQMPTDLLAHLQETFTLEKMGEVFTGANYVMLFGEGCGPKIQSGGYYRKKPLFVLFDVYCSGWWLTREGVAQIGSQLDVPVAPVIYHGWQKADLEFEKDGQKFVLEGQEQKKLWTLDEIVEYVKSRPNSIIAEDEHVMEGIIARSEPLMMFRKGGPIMFKLKCEDFE